MTDVVVGCGALLAVFFGIVTLALTNLEEEDCNHRSGASGNHRSHKGRLRVLPQEHRETNNRTGED